jgi:hypothetical protein
MRHAAQQLLAVEPASVQLAARAVGLTTRRPRAAR